MSIEVKLPTILRRHTGGQAVVRGEGATLREVLEDVDARHPGILGSVVTDDGSLHRFVNVYVNDEDVRYLGSLETEVKGGDVVSILPAVAGGARVLPDGGGGGSSAPRPRIGRRPGLVERYALVSGARQR